MIATMSFAQLEGCKAQPANLQLRTAAERLNSLLALSVLQHNLAASRNLPKEKVGGSGTFTLTLTSDGRALSPMA